ncbi:MAG: hypothetical protein CVU05_02920 [Bacteroidetes bacterium HGW-Bacteroidetes-21]|jgi:TM2 domain-containing membrane protein YozV|nr:MAG: hypothetical protein CVU05_02920 [Bacteroidetes bacterium HGW-Bacteroidetes-21]
MKIFLTITILSCILRVNAQNDNTLNGELLALEFAVWNSSDSREMSSLIMQKAEKLTENGQFSAALNELNRIQDKRSTDSNQLVYMKALNEFLLGDFDNAYNLLLDIPDSARNHEIEYQILWLFTLNELERWSDCRQILLNLSDSMILLKPDIEALPTRIDYTSPIKARRLSTFFPGIGQMYAGSSAKGITSIMLHAAFVFVLVEGVVTGFYVAGAVYGLMPIFRFYIGGRQNSYTLAKDRNSDMSKVLKDRYMELILLVGGQGSVNQK